MVLGVIMSKKKDDKVNDARQALENKVKLDRKLYLAKENPEPIFDLSDCDLQRLPTDVFSLCRGFGKNALFLQNNELTDLVNGGPLENLKHIKILNISANNFEKLSNDLHVLESLEVLDVSRNQLQALPNSIGRLANLKNLNASDNLLSNLPDSLGNCTNLNVLNIKNNKYLKQLPLTLGKLHSLVELGIDQSIVFPPKEIYMQGVKAVISFLSKESANSPTSSILKKSDKTLKSPIQTDDSSKDYLYLSEKHKKGKKMELITMEKEIWESREKEAKLQKERKEKKDRLIEEVKNQQKAIDAEIAKIQGVKDEERSWLVQYCINEEEKSADIVNKILSANKKLRVKTADVLEDEKKQEEEWLSQNLVEHTLERKLILISMDEQMKEEVQKAQKAKEQKRLFVIKSLASELLSQDNALNSLISKSEKMHADGVEIIRKNEDFQKSAVASLLEKSDATSWKLTKQIAIIEEKLAELTKLELMKKKVEADTHIAELNKNRQFLAQELMELFQQQNERRKKLISMIRKMEALKDSDSYWMEQYERLLHSKSYHMVGFLEAVHPTLAHELFLNGVFQYLPLLKNVALSIELLQNLNDGKLSNMGIKNSQDRASILKAINTFLEPPKEKPSAPQHKKPSAPPISDIANEAFKSSSYSVPEDCVICLELKPAVIFIPCGHICCCEKCFHSVSLCPLCRQKISEFHEMIYQH